MKDKGKEWETRWICSPRFKNIKPLQLLHREWDLSFQSPDHREDLKNSHTMFRKSFQLSGKVKKAVLNISADDHYRLYVNGVYVTQGPANSYAFCYYYNQVDITEYLKTGRNIIAVHVYYQGLVNRAYNSGDYRQGMIAELWADGVQLLDSDWKCRDMKEYGRNRTIGYDTQFDEIIDNRKKLTGWETSSFDDLDWDRAAIREDDDHVFIPQPCDNVVIEKRIPVQIEKLSDGYLLDFGEELTGTFCMRAAGHAGDEVIILYGEELLSPDTAADANIRPGALVRYEMRCGCRYEDRLILAEGDNELETFEYKCFRYVQLLTEARVAMEDFQVLFRHYPFDDSKCRFHTDNPLIRQIWDICRNAVRNCCQEGFLDCPSREKGQYLGDLTVTAHALYCLTGATDLFRKALMDFAHSTDICSGMMAVAPGSFMQEIADYSLLYPYQLLLYYHFTGDRGFLKMLYPAAEGVEKYFEQFRNDLGLLEQVNTKWNLVDWPENLRDNYDFALPHAPVGKGCHNVLNALYIGMKQCMEKLRMILQIPEDSASLPTAISESSHSKASEAERLKQTFIECFFDKKTGLFVDSTISRHSSIHANAFAAFFNLAPEENNIAAFIMKKGLCCGVFVSYFVLYGLLRLGQPRAAYELIINKSEHSWYQMLSEGATGAFEAWGKEQKWNTSLCHAWASAPIPVLTELEGMDYPFPSLTPL